MGDPMRRLVVEHVDPRLGRGGWHGGPTAAGALRGVSAADAVWRPAPGRKSIWDLTLHIAYWRYAVRRRLTREPTGGFPRAPANWPRVPAEPSTAAWRADVALLKTEHQRLVAAVASVPPRRYGEVLPGGKQWTVGELILGIAQHDAYHVGQIQMLKRLRAARRAGG